MKKWTFSCVCVFLFGGIFFYGILNANSKTDAHIDGPGPMTVKCIKCVVSEKGGDPTSIAARPGNDA